MRIRFQLFGIAAVWACVTHGCVMHGGANRKRVVARYRDELPRILERQQPAPATAVVALTNVSIFDGSGLSALSTVIINGDIIGPIVPFGQLPVAGAQVIDGRGGVLLPGLFDNHCHPSSIDDLQNLAKYGVTTAIGMACLSYDLCNPLRDQTGLPSFVTTGLAAIAPGSPHAELFDTPTADTISSPDQAPQFVANVFGNNSAFLKIVAEPGGPDQDTINALVEYTHNAGHVSTTHATFNASYNQAITSKTDSIQHVPLDIPLTTAMAQQILQQKQFVTPTLNVYPYLLPLTGIPGGIPAGSSYANAAQSAETLYQHGVQILVGTDSFIDPDNPALAVSRYTIFAEVHHLTGRNQDSIR